MSEYQHYPHWIQKLIEDLPPLKVKKNPLLAGILGFLFGGLGIGLYFQSWKDGVYLVVVFLMLSFLLAPLVVVGPLIALLFAGVWGFARAANSGTV